MLLDRVVARSAFERTGPANQAACSGVSIKTEMACDKYVYAVMKTKLSGTCAKNRWTSASFRKGSFRSTHRITGAKSAQLYHTDTAIFKDSIHEMSVPRMTGPSRLSELTRTSNVQKPKCRSHRRAGRRARSRL